MPPCLAWQYPIVPVNCATFSFQSFNIFCVWVFSLNVCIYTMFMSGAYRGQKMDLDPLKLQLWVVVSLHVGAGTGLWTCGSKWSCEWMNVCCWHGRSHIKDQSLMGNGKAFPLGEAQRDGSEVKNTALTANSGLVLSTNMVAPTSYNSSSSVSVTGSLSRGSWKPAYERHHPIFVFYRPVIPENPLC